MILKYESGDGGQTKEDISFAAQTGLASPADIYGLVAHPCRSDDVGGFLHDGDSTLRFNYAGPDISTGPGSAPG